MDIVRQWEEFAVGPGDAGRRMHVSMDRKGTLLLGRTVFELMGEPEAVVLLFDRINSTIGVRPAQTLQANAYPILAKTGVTCRVIRSNRFCRHYSIRVPNTVAFDHPQIDPDGTLVLDLKTTRNVSR
ncbi:MAG: hypothetical protein ABJA02_06415 [Acidobacteriota bacterium]